MQKLFSYGTLQFAKVQFECFGRQLSGHSDVLPRYEVRDCKINDPHVLQTSGMANHPIACFTGDPSHHVSGMVFEITDEELAQADTYEVEDYKRVKRTLGSGEQSWVYVQSGLNIDPRYLQEGSIQLVPFQDDHIVILSELAQDTRIWEHHRTQYQNPERFKNSYIADAKASIAQKSRFMFVIYYLDKIVGSTSYYDIQLNHLSMHIGYTWFHPDYWGKGINPIVKKLMLSYAINQLKFKRVAFCIDAENLRSRAAIEKLNIPLEAILKKHQIRPDGSSRDSVIYAITDDIFSPNRGLL